MDKVGIGIVGCGNISGAYLKAMRHFPILDIRGLADADPAAAEARAGEFGLAARPVDDLLADPAIEIVVNLTVPKAHVAVGLRALEAGKHTYSEKPLGVTVAEGRRLVEEAAARGLRVGAAPDTFLGGAHQTARRLVDEGAIGQPVAGTAVFMCPGHERWHPNPGFYYEAGGGPMLDMGPYYITDLVNLLGPVAEVAGFATMPRSERVIESAARKGERIAVSVPTHVAGAMLFANGAVVQITMSFDVEAHRHLPIELYGTEGTLIVPDPNLFGGAVELMRRGGGFEPVATDQPYADFNYRSLGVADMAHALRSGRAHRASGDLALHVLEVMEAFHVAAESGRTVRLTTAPERPEALRSSLSEGVLAQ